MDDSYKYFREEDSFQKHHADLNWPSANSHCSAPVCSDLRSRLDALSQNAKYWLHTTCNRFGEGEGYDPDPVSISECYKAGIIKKCGKFIDVPPDVMELVYSEGYLQNKLL